MVEYQAPSNVHDDLDDLLAEVADAHLPGYQEASGTQPANDEMAGMTAAQKKRRKKKNKKKEMKAAGHLKGRVLSQEEQMAESKRQFMTPLREKLGASL